MLTEHEEKLTKEQIEAYENMVQYCERQISKLYKTLNIERCCFHNKRTRLPIAK
jgi:hypothetical protein